MKGGKKTKYQELVEEYRKKSRKTSTTPIQLGCRRYTVRFLISTLASFGLTGNKKNKAIKNECLENSKVVINNEWEYVG